MYCVDCLNRRLYLAIQACSYLHLNSRIDSIQVVHIIYGYLLYGSGIIFAWWLNICDCSDILILREIQIDFIGTALCFLVMSHCEHFDAFTGCSVLQPLVGFWFGGTAACTVARNGIQTDSLSTNFTA